MLLRRSNRETPVTVGRIAGGKSKEHAGDEGVED
jgi:hypothetical protein